MDGLDFIVSTFVGSLFLLHPFLEQLNWVLIYWAGRLNYSIAPIGSLQGKVLHKDK